MPASFISQYALRKKQPASASRIRLIKSPSTVAENGHSVIIPLVRIQTTPRRGMIPSSRESTSIMARKLPPVICGLIFSRTTFCVTDLGAGRRFAGLAPELVSGAANKNVLECRLAHRDALDFSRESLDHIGYKSVSILTFNPHLVFQDSGLDQEAHANSFRQQSCVPRGFQNDDVAADFAFQFRWGTQRYQIPFVQDGQPVAALGFFHQMRGHEDGNMFFIAQGLQILPQVAARSGIKTGRGLIEK